jgi:two-component system response regulator YesN
MYSSEKPDAVLMDIELEGTDGLTAAAKIKELAPNSKIIFLSDYNDKQYRAKAAEIGCIAYILKENLFELNKHLKELQ